MNEATTYFVYILLCSDGSYYVGHTDNIDLRIQRHIEGRGATWTAKRIPVNLVYQESYPDLKSAVRRETQIKKWSRAKKEALIAGDLNKLKILSRARSTQN